MTVMTPIAAPARAVPPQSQATRTSRFLPHVHTLRAVAILLVVGAHCWPDFAWTPAQQRWVMLVFDNVTVVFMAISGLLFQHLSSRFVYRRYVAHRFANVILPYLIVSIPAVLMAVFVQHRDGVWPGVYRLPAWEQIGYFYLTGKQLAPLWFMPMMALFILASPLSILIDRRNLYPLLLPVLIVIATMLGRDSIGGIANVFGKALFMWPAYMAGMAFGRHRARAEAAVARWWPAILAALVLVSVAIFRDWLGDGPADASLIQKLLFASLLLVAIKRIPAGRVTRALAPLADLSFAIYFVHGYVITGFRILYERFVTGGTGAAPFAPSIAGMVVHVVLVTAISLALIRIVQAVLGPRSRMVIGA